MAAVELPVLPGLTKLQALEAEAIHIMREVASELERPVLLHVRTVKGRGYEPAEERPSEFHGTGPFDRSNGERKASPRGTTYTEAFGHALVREARADSTIVAVTAAMTERRPGDTTYVSRTVYRLPGGNRLAAPEAVTVKAGITDGIATEVVGDLKEGDLIITSISLPSAKTGGTQTSNPFGGGMRRF